MLLSEKSDEVTRFKKKTKRYFLIQHAVKTVELLATHLAGLPEALMISKGY